MHKKWSTPVICGCLVLVATIALVGSRGYDTSKNAPSDAETGEMNYEVNEAVPEVILSEETVNVVPRLYSNDYENQDLYLPEDEEELESYDDFIEDTDINEIEEDAEETAYKTEDNEIEDEDAEPVSKYDVYIDYSMRYEGEDIPWESVEEGSDLYWLAKLINAEAGGEPYVGKIGVGNVAVNRMNDDYYAAENIEEVVFRPGQFSVVGNRLDDDPNQQSINAAYDVLYNGRQMCEDMPQKVLYFNTRGKWWKGIDFWVKVGNHYFGISTY